MSILALAARTASVIRPQALPVQGRLFRRGLEEPVGHAFADEAGTDDVVVVESRDPLPRGPQPLVHGLTVQLSREDGTTCDLMLSASSWSRVSRRVRAGVGLEWTMTGVLPVEDPDEAPAGEALLLAARRVGGHTYELAVARHGEPWQEFACLLLSSRVAA